MENTVKAPFLILVLVSAAPCLAGPACLAGKRASLIGGHFSGAIVCSRKDASFRLAGQTTGKKYLIYDYRYRFLAHAGGVMHGGQRLVVFRGKTYVGQYALSPPPYTDVRVEGSQIELGTPGNRETVRLDFSRKPPARFFFGGETEAFSR